MKTKEKQTATDVKSYVWEYENNDVYNNNGVPVIVTAKSESDAANQFLPQTQGCGGWIRLAGDEPRIAAINKFATAQYRLGILDRKIEVLNAKRNDLVSESEHLRAQACQWPDGSEEIPF